MKTVKFNTFSVFVVAILAGSTIFYLPVYLIESFWNNFIAITYPEYTIDFWQALILWLALLTLIYSTGIFKFEIALESTDSIDKEKFKKHIENITKKAKDATKSEVDTKAKETIDKT